MDDLAFGIEEEELELDYEAEEARKAKEIASIRQDSDDKNQDEEDDESNVSEEESKDVKMKEEVKEESFTQRSRKRRASSPVKWNRGYINDYNEVEPGRDIIRAKRSKRFRYQPELLPNNFFPDEKDPNEELEDEIDDHPPLTKAEIASLFDSLMVDMDDDTVPLNTILVHGVEGMTHYQLEKVFAEYHPHIVLFVDTESCIVQFRQSRIASKMLIGMTKKLKRVRRPKKIEEEGEIMDSEGEEEEGQTKTEDGEPVQIVRNPDFLKNTNTNHEYDEVPIDITAFKVPIGKWRVVTKHLPSNKILIVRYAKQSEILKASRNTANTEYRTERANDVKYRNRVPKGGINVFDSTGKELPWNFEHDTRIFDDPTLKTIEKSEKEEKPEQPREENIKVGDRVIHSKGRGTKRALNLRFSSDEEEDDTSEDDNESMEDTIDDSILDMSPKESDNYRSQVLNSK